MLSKGSLTVLPVVTDNVAYNLQMQPASKAASGSSGQTNYLYVSPNLVFNPATNQLVFNTSVVFGGTATYANGSPVGSGTNATVNTANATVNTATATVNTAAAYAFTNSTASGNATSGAITTTGGIGVANNVYVGGRIGWSNSINISVAYTYYNANTNSLDTVFG